EVCGSLRGLVFRRHWRAENWRRTTVSRQGTAEMQTCKEGSAAQNGCSDAPKGQQQTSPGQRPGTTLRRNDRALKGRHKPFYSALSGLENKLGTMTNLGRCPRLVCSAPLGRNSATADNPMNVGRSTFQSHT